MKFSLTLTFFHASSWLRPIIHSKTIKLAIFVKFEYSHYVLWQLRTGSEIGSSILLPVSVLLLNCLANYLMQVNVNCQMSTLSFERSNDSCQMSIVKSQMSNFTFHLPIVNCQISHNTVLASGHLDYISIFLSTSNHLITYSS